MTLRKALTVGAENHRHVGVDRRLGAERLEDIDLPRRIVDMVVAADNVGNLHLQIVDDDGEIVGRRAVRACDHEIVELGIGDDDTALDHVLDDDIPLEGILETHDRLDAGRRSAGACATTAIVAGLESFRPLLVAHGIELLRCAVAMVGLALAEQSLDVLAIAFETLSLVVGPLVVVEAQPTHGAEDGVDRCLRGTLPIRVLDTQNENAAVAARKQPAEQCRARAADVKIAGGARGKSSAYLHARRAVSMSERSPGVPHAPARLTCFKGSP